MEGGKQSDVLWAVPRGTGKREGGQCFLGSLMFAHFLFTMNFKPFFCLASVTSYSHYFVKSQVDLPLPGLPEHFPVGGIWSRLYLDATLHVTEM